MPSKHKIEKTMSQKLPKKQTCNGHCQCFATSTIQPYLSFIPSPAPPPPPPPKKKKRKKREGPKNVSSKQQGDELLKHDAELLAGPAGPQTITAQKLLQSSTHPQACRAMNKLLWPSYETSGRTRLMHTRPGSGQICCTPFTSQMLLYVKNSKLVNLVQLHPRQS